MPSSSPRAPGGPGIGADTLVVAYDEDMSGGAARLWWLLRHFGHDAVGVLGGALPSWLGPLAEGEEAIEPAEFVPRERSDDVATTEEILDRLGDPSLVLVDARPADRYRGEALGLDPVAGHIPGAISVPPASARPCRRSCSTQTRSSPTAARALPLACRCSRFIEPGARMRASIRARGASGRARACRQRLDACAERVPTLHA